MKKKLNRIFLFTPLAILVCFVLVGCSKKSTKERRPSCSISPKGWLDFGEVEVCCGSRYKSFTITNTGGGTLSGSVSADCDHFSIVSDNSSYSLGAGQFREFTVEFRPESEGEEICDIETGNGLCADVFCRGKGVNPPP